MLPNHICYTCLNQLQSVYSFKLKLEKTLLAATNTNDNHLKHPTQMEKANDHIANTESIDTMQSKKPEYRIRTITKSYMIYQCELCKRGFQLKGQFQQHYLRHSTKPNQYHCQKCDLHFLVATHFHKHKCD